MRNKPNDFKVGLFIFFGVAILLAGLFIFGASKWFEGKTVEETYVTKSVEGLKVGAPVLLHGVPVGEVTKINFSWNVYHVTEPRYVVVEFEVGNQVALVPPGRGYEQRVQQEVVHGLRARIKSQGLAGATILSLEYVSNPAENPPLQVPWKPDHVYIPSAPGQMSQIMASAEAISSKLKEIDFQQIGTQVQRDLAAVETLLHHANQADVAGLGTNLNALVSDLRGVSSRLQAFVGQTNAPPPANLQQISSDADKLLAGLRETSSKVDRMVGNLDVTSLNESLENIRHASEELAEAVHRFREYPAGTFFGKRPPPATSVEQTK
jgi:ABC-type transporter Mla subunit MlaD